MPNPNAFRETHNPEKASRANEKQATRNPKQNSPGRMKSDAFPDIKGVRAASLDDPSGLEPKAEVWTSRAYPWDALDPELPQLKAEPTEEEVQAFLASVS